MQFVGIILIILILIFCCSSTAENLRMYGSFDLRGDVPIGGPSFTGPWNIGTSYPMQRRRMEIESDYY